MLVGGVGGDGCRQLGLPRSSNCLSWKTPSRKPGLESLHRFYQVVVATTGRMATFCGERSTRRYCIKRAQNENRNVYL